MLRQQRGPRRIGREAGCWNPLLVASGNVHGEQRRSAIAAGIAKEHQDAAIRRKGRSLVVESARENPLARTVGFHDADGKLSGTLFGEGDVVAARPPPRGRIAALAQGNPLRRPAGRRHHVDLRLAAAGGFETYAGAVVRIGRRGIDRGSISEAWRRLSS